jgi:hypothetical protein
MTEIGEDPKLAKKPRQAFAFFCPNCGVPRSISKKLDTLFVRSKEKKLRFHCFSCGIRLTLEYGWPKDKDESFNLSMRDIVDGAKGVKTVINVLK